MVMSLDFNARHIMRELYKEDRWGLLTVLLLHTNDNNRCWPSMDSLAHEMGISLRRITRAKSWLLEHLAIELIPLEKRSGKKEEDLPKRQHVYHLTGTVKVEGQTYSYLHFNREETKQVSNGVNIPDDPQPKVSTIENNPVENITGGNLSYIQEKVISKEVENTFLPDAIAPAQPGEAKTINEQLEQTRVEQESQPAPGQELKDSTPGSAAPLPAGTELRYQSRLLDQESWSHVEHVVKAKVLSAKPTCRRCKQKLDSDIVSQTPAEGVVYTRCIAPPKKASAVSTKKARDAPKPWSALTKAMHEATPPDIRPPRCNYAKNDRPAKACFDEGISPERVTRFVEATYPGYRRWAEENDRPIVMSMHHVCEQIKGWEAKQNGHQTKPTTDQRDNQNVLAAGERDSDAAWERRQAEFAKRLSEM